MDTGRVIDVVLNSLCSRNLAGGSDSSSSS